MEDFIDRDLTSNDSAAWESSYGYRTQLPTDVCWEEERIEREAAQLTEKKQMY